MFFWGGETKKGSSKIVNVNITCKSWHCQETRIKVERGRKEDHRGKSCAFGFDVFDEQKIPNVCSRGA